MNSQAIRTSGDGTEYPEKTNETTARKLRSSTSSTADNEKIDKLGKEFLLKKIKSSSNSIYGVQPVQEGVHNFPTEVKPNGKKFFLIPKLIEQKAANTLKTKAPKLILMEPYRACVSPILPLQFNNRIKKPKSSKNNLDLNELVRHMKAGSQSSKLSDAGGDDELSQLKKERNQFESQLKFQMQVNSELKGLLVHCLGEDIQSKVSNLTEDKMKIAEHLSSNTEKIEYLAGQSEVWRSKFLACSLMVEELAKVKASLTEKNRHLVTSNKNLLETVGVVRDMQVEVYQNLQFLSGFHETKLKTSNVIDLTSECVNLSQQLVLNSGKIGMPELQSSLINFDPLTEAQKQALIAIQDTNDCLSSADEAFKAICNQANQEYRRVSQTTQPDDTSFEILEVKDAK